MSKSKVDLLSFMRKMAQEVLKWPEWMRRVRLMDKDRQYKRTEHKEEREKEVCPKCQGEGWLWDFELDNYMPDPHDASVDDQKYSCDACRKRREEEDD